jgi:hypothetical protein
MGVCLVAYAISDQNLDAILADPPLVWRVVSQDDDSSYLKALGAGARPSFWGRLFGRMPTPMEPKTLSLDEPQRYVVDLDKSWDGLNRVLAALAPSAPNFFDAAEFPGGIEVGYGVALYQRSPVVSQVAAAWASISQDDLRQALHSIDFRGAYLDGVWLRRDDEALEYLTENFAFLKAFVAHAQRHGLGALIQMT